MLALAQEVLRAAGEAEAELYLRVAERGCARFAIGELGQHMQLAEPQAVVRVARGARVAETVTSRLDRGALVDAVRATGRAATLVPEVEAFPGFTRGDEPAGPSPDRCVAATANATPEERVERLAPVLSAIRDAGLVSAGMLETTAVSHAMATTGGCARSYDATLASFRVWALATPGAGGPAGYGGQVHADVGALRLAEETERAIRVCRMSKEPASLEAGSYDVVMEPEAVTELLEWLAAIRLGERITGEGVDLVEDPLSDDPALGFGAPFDREGTWKRRVPLVENGVARAILYDRTCAARMGAASTGSAQLPAPGSDGGVGPTSLMLGAGTAAGVDDLLAGVRRGLYVCRLHYVNGLLDPRRAVMTGLTRDGCFLVENGKIGRAVGNLRFTDSLLEGLARCDGMTRERKAVPTWWSDSGAFVSPAVRIRGWRFNGKSQEATLP
jgi:predicted Zn-dependent protease